MSKFGCFVNGLAIGAIGGGIAALMLTPKNGEENRKLVADYANNVMNTGKDFGDQAYSVFQGGIKSATEIGGGFVDSVKSAADVAGSQVSDKNDELRAKIEAARDRIAEQVKKNNEVQEDVEVKTEWNPTSAEGEKEEKKDAEQLSFSTAEYLGRQAYLTTDETDDCVTVKKVGRIHFFVFSEHTCVGVLIKRPDVAMMIRRKDIFAPLQSINFQKKSIILDADYEKQGSAFLKKSGIKLSQTFVYDGMEVETEGGRSLGTIESVTCSSGGMVSDIKVSDGVASDKLLGTRAIPADLIVGMKMGSGEARLVSTDGKDDEGAGVFLVKDEAADIKLVGGAAQKAAATSVKVASQVKEKAVPAIAKGKDASVDLAKKGAKAAGKNYETTKKGILGFKEEFKKAYSAESEKDD